MNDWGDIKIEKIDSSTDFWALYDELIDDNSGFVNNRHTLLDAYKVGKMYGLRVSETESMYNGHARLDPTFAKSTFYLLPCFCIVDEDIAHILWVHSRARRNGFATRLVKMLNITRAYCILKESEAFWESVGVKGIN